MPSRGSYHIANREEGKMAQRDQSYRSCVLTMLIFFLLCVVLILICLPWKRSYSPNYGYKDNAQSSEHHREAHRTSTTEEPVEVLTKRVDDVKRGPFERYSNNATSTETSETPKTTVQFTTASTTSRTTERIAETSTALHNSTKSIGVILASEETTTARVLTEEQSSTKSSISTIPLTITHTESTTAHQSIETSEGSSTASLSSTIATDSTIKEYTTENSVSTVTESHATESEGTTIEYEASTTGKYNVDRKETSTTEKSTTDAHETSTTEEHATDFYETSTEGKTESPVTQAEETVTTRVTFRDSYDNGTTYSTAHDTTTEQGETTETPVSTSETFATTALMHDEKICETGECKQLASRMLFYMNHSADPCEDFYEYACGGFEANPQTIEQNLEDIAYQRISRQMREENRRGVSSLFSQYYNSCIKYEDTEFEERIKLAKAILSEVGKFYTTYDWRSNSMSFTELVAKLLLHHSALLFDVASDLDEFSPTQFTIKIGPTTYRSPFDTTQTEDPCQASQSGEEEEEVDLYDLYGKYKTCKKDTRKFLASISEALSALGVCDAAKYTYNITQCINITVMNIDFEIVRNFYAKFPPKNKIREAYLMKNYTHVTMDELDRNSKLVNWAQLIFLLTKASVKGDARVQVYFYDALIEGLKSLEKLQEANPKELHNAVLGLYAHNLYHELVLPKHRNAKNHCIRVAANLLIPEASKLYISSFSENERTYMTETIHSTFSNLRDTLRLKIKEANWANDEGRVALLNKTDDLRVATPDISYFNTGISTYERYNANKRNLSDNYLNNSIILMQRYRTLIYLEMLRNPGHSEQIWTHFATPFQSKGLAIYGLNLVVIPFGIVDWSMKYNESLFDYLLLATLGNAIAHQIAHHFDANGIYYWNGTRDTEYSLLNDHMPTKSNFDDYVKCQSTDLYENPIKMILPSTGQVVSYKIPKLTLNERLSETMGLRLAYDTLERLRSHEEIHLPWLKLNFDQLYYLAYAQMHCTKSPLTSSYTSLYEDEQLPSRIRILVSASHNKLLGKAWNCPDGSLVTPSYTCSVFPYLQFYDSIIYTE